MPKDCQHNHENEAKSDCWTKFTASGESIISLISDTYWLAKSFDLISGYPEEILSVSWPALIFGTLAGSLSAAGGTYSHWALNKNHQNQDPENSPLLNGRQNGHQTNKLRWWQKLALAGDSISHAGEAAAPLTFIAELATKGKMSKTGKLLVQCGATFFGGVYSVAPVRTCMNNMKQRLH